MTRVDWKPQRQSLKKLISHRDARILVSIGVANGAEARQRGAPTLAETCPQYLVLDESILRRPDGFRYVCSPPVRSLED